MTRYTAKQISKSTFFIYSERNKVGSISATETGFTAVINRNGEKFIGRGASWKGAFSAAMDAMSPERHKNIAAYNAVVREHNRGIRAKNAAARREFQLLSADEQINWLCNKIMAS